MQIQLSEHFNYRKLLKFTFPSIIMMIFTSIYGVVDGIFVSNFVGKSAFAAVNFVMPIPMILGGIGFMFGSGGSAIIAKTMGENRPEEAKKQFSLFVYAAAILGAVLAAIGLAFIRPAAQLLGAEGEMLELGVTYGRILICALPAFILQNAFQSFFITAEKPDLGLKVTVISGVSNMVLDALLIVVIPWGITGAALATAISQCIGCIMPLCFFARENTSPLKLTKTSFHAKTLIDASINGSSEFVSNITMSVVSMLYNFQLLKYAGEDGVAAYGVIMYINMIFLAVFIGYSMGTAPIVSYHYGANNYDELKSLRKKSTVIILIASVFMFALAEVLARPLAMIFSGYDQALFDMTVRAFLIYSFSFLFTGFGIWSSSFFTALNNGVVSAIISFLRTLVFQVVAVFILPFIFDLDGIWLSVVVAECLAAIVGIIYLVVLRKRYKY